MAEGPITSLLSRWGMGSGRNSAVPHLEGSNIDRRTLEKLQRLLEKLVKSCDNPALALKRSPPYLLDLLPHMYQTLQEIFKLHESKMQDLNNNEYFRLFIDNVCNKLKRGLKLFKDNRNIFNDSSTERKSLTRLSLHISHMLYELKALFPNNVYIGSTYRITKEEAEEFWKSNFGEKTIVLWKDFRTALSLVHPITSSYEAMALKSTIDLTHNDMVSVFEFDVFTRLFQPWNTLLVNWKMIAVTHTGYQAFLTYGEVKEKLQRWVHKPGTYIFRLSCTRLGQWAIGYVTNEHEILQTIPQNKSLCEALILGAQDGYYLYPDGKEQNPDLSVIQQEKQKKVIQVSEEEYEIYFSMGSTFQQCKICQENDKDVKLEPCAHLLCSECLFAWQEHDKSASLTCPFCRAQVKDYENIEIDPFQKQQAFHTMSSKENGDASPRGSHPPPPPIPDRNAPRGSVCRPPPPEINKMPQVSPVSNRQAIAPPPSVPRRNDSTDAPIPSLNSPPSRPPPLPPSLGSLPQPDNRPPLPDMPPPLPNQPPPPNLGNLPPPPPISQPPGVTDTPGDSSFSTSSGMSTTNPFFSDVQALRTPAPPSTAPPSLGEDMCVRRTSPYADVTDTGPVHDVSEGEACYNDPCYNDPEQSLPLEKPMPMFGTQRNLESITPSSWSSGMFEDDTPPPIQEDHGLYCNFELPTTPKEPSPEQLTYDNFPGIVQPTMDEPSPIMSTHPISDPAPRSSLGSLGIENIALRPSSIVDPDMWLFDGDAGENHEDIYENQGPSTPSPPPPETTVDKLIALGYSAEDVGRATAIVGDNYDMSLMILKSFR